MTLTACDGMSATQRAQSDLDAGLQAHIAGDLALAKAKYSDCLRLEATNKACLYNNGLIAQTEGRAAEAENGYRLALLVDPVYAPALYNLALLITPTLPDEAVTVFQRYLEINPDDPDGHYNFGLLLRARGDEAGAVAQLERAHELDPTLRAPIPPGS